MRGVDKIEFYVGNNTKYEAVVSGSIVPRVGELISIRKVTYQVTAVTYAVDAADDWTQTNMRANVIMKKKAIAQKGGV